jgi:hypothetical protein
VNGDNVSQRTSSRFSEYEVAELVQERARVLTIDTHVAHHSPQWRISAVADREQHVNVPVEIPAKLERAFVRGLEHQTVRSTLFELRERGPVIVCGRDERSRVDAEELRSAAKNQPGLKPNRRVPVLEVRPLDPQIARIVADSHRRRLLTCESLTDGTREL